MRITVEESIQRIQNGEMIIITDSDDRENEGDIFLPAVFANAEKINFICKYARGLICTPMKRERLQALQIPLMVADNQDKHATAFTVSVDARENTSTGISAFDRSRTLQLLASEKATPADFTRPGHIFPLMSHDDGLAMRQGHTEAAVDLLKAAGLPEVGTICEIMNDDGTMARCSDLEKFAQMHGLGIVSIEKIIEYLGKGTSSVQLVSKTVLPTRLGNFELFAFEERSTKKCHLVLRPVQFNETCDCPKVRIHSECLTGDVFESLRCDCHSQLENFLQLMQKDWNSLLIYLRQEGRDIGLANKIRAYSLQDQGLDTVEANLALGYQADERDYKVAADILRILGHSRVQLVTNNPGKISSLGKHSITVVDVVSHWTDVNEKNAKYIATKINRMGHICNDKGEKKNVI
jgi:3,4-dihydroxy 2-butanone 4-phosphate synthase/GTP cyclohydrolase II